jgi:hypothetical protein
VSLYDPLRKLGWSESKIQTWLATPLTLLCDLSPGQLDPETLERLIGTIKRLEEVGVAAKRLLKGEPT